MLCRHPLLLTRCVAARASPWRAAAPAPLRTAASQSLGVGVQQSLDVAIVGGGVVGASIALHLAVLAPKLRIAVFERDSTYAYASAPRSAGGIRAQFSNRANVELSLYGLEFLRTGLRELCADIDVDADVQFRENGYLMLASLGKGEDVLRENLAVQHAAGATCISKLDNKDLNERFPWLSTEGLAGGAFGEQGEGYFDPWALLQAMRKCGLARGVKYVSQQVMGVALHPGGGKIAALQLADGSSVAARTIVNAAGAHGGHIVDMCGADVAKLPVVPRKRCMWQFNVREQTGGPPMPPENTPLTIDVSGAYFRSEGSQKGNFVCGMSPPADCDMDYDASDPALFEALDYVDEDLFMETIWPTLAQRVPALEALKVESSWAGFYEYNTLDQNGVIGWHPDVKNLLIACGFSGHGLQQSPGVGRACAELLVHGDYSTVDASCFGFERILRCEPLLERGIY